MLLVLELISWSASPSPPDPRQVIDITTAADTATAAITAATTTAAATFQAEDATQRLPWECIRIAVEDMDTDTQVHEQQENTQLHGSEGGGTGALAATAYSSKGSKGPGASCFSDRQLTSPAEPTLHVEVYTGSRFVVSLSTVTSVRFLEALSVRSAERHKLLVVW